MYDIVKASTGTLYGTIMAFAGINTPVIASAIEISFIIGTLAVGIRSVAWSAFTKAAFAFVAGFFRIASLRFIATMASNADYGWTTPDW